MKYASGKIFTHEVGLSCAFRQWRAESHCRFVHGYALQVELEFEAAELDERNWVVDFGGLKDFKEWLVMMFDHTLLVAEDDPDRDTLLLLDRRQVAQVRLVKAVGCEAFAEMTANSLEWWLRTQSTYWPRVDWKSVTVREHGANWARVTKDQT